MEMRLRTPVTRGYFLLVNPASPRTISIDKKKISSGTQGRESTVTWSNGRDQVAYRKGGLAARAEHEKRLPVVALRARACVFRWPR